MFLFLFAIIFSNIESSFFRAEGNAKRATRAVFLSAFLNVILAYIYLYLKFRNERCCAINSRALLLQLVFAYLFCFIFRWGINGIYAGIIFGTAIGSLIGYIWAKIYIINKLEKKTH